MIALHGDPTFLKGLDFLLRGDSDYAAKLFQSIKGPVVAVGHSYGGAVITDAAVDSPNVKALVFVAGVALDKGESVAALVGRFPGSTLGPTLAAPVALPGGGKDLYIQQDKFPAQFAADLPKAETRLMAATQRPVTESALNEPSGPAAWKRFPSWFIFGSLERSFLIGSRILPRNPSVRSRGREPKRSAGRLVMLPGNSAAKRFGVRQPSGAFPVA